MILSCELTAISAGLLFHLHWVSISFSVSLRRWIPHVFCAAYSPTPCPIIIRAYCAVHPWQQWACYRCIVEPAPTHRCFLWQRSFAVSWTVIYRLAHGILNITPLRGHLYYSGQMLYCPVFGGEMQITLKLKYNLPGWIYPGFAITHRYGNVRPWGCSARG